MERKILTFLFILSFFFAGCGEKDEAIIIDGENETETVLETKIFSETTNDITNQTNNGEICVYVCGEVKKPGVYILKSGKRAGDAVKIAGGFTSNADDTKINLAMILEDGQQITIPDKSGQIDMSATSDESGIVSETDKININTASKEQLMMLNGIGDARALAIIAYREHNGGFGTIEDIMNVSGIKQAAFDKIKDNIVVK